MGRLNLGAERGQSLVMVAIFLPVLFAFFALVVNTGHAFGEKRRVQNAADAAALAASQELVKPECSADDDAMRACVQAVASDYVERNLPPEVVAGIPLPLARCTPPGDPDPDPVVTNCYSWPYYKDGVERRGQVEVRLRYGVSTFFLEVLGSFTPWNVGARAVAGALPIEECTAPLTETPNDVCPPIVDEDECIYPVPEGGEPDDVNCPPIPSDDAQLGVLDPAEDAHCIFDPAVEDPDQYLIAVPPCRTPDRWEGGLDGAQAFTMGRACDSIWYTGAGGGQIGAFATNGGLTFVGNKDKRVGALGFDKARCGDLLPEPPNGPACETTPRGGPGADYCVHELVDFSDIIPLNWPVPPPPLPIPLPAGTPWDPSAHYPDYCVLLDPDPDTGVVTLAAVPGPPGVYCVSGPDTRLLINTSMTEGDGYTFFALDGARIEVASNGTSVKFYWPSECSSIRPTARTLSFTCFGRTISGYDPLTVLYSTNATAIIPSSGTTTDQQLCELSAICLRGQGGSIDGDFFAPHPLVFPPELGPPPQTGGTVWVAGGSASAGSGFIESWALVIQGNGGSYTGTGPLVGGQFIPGQQGTLDPGTDSHCIFDPPVEDPDQYLTSTPPCFFPGSDPTHGEFVEADPTLYATPIIVGADVSMDE